jgi:hypothetical protein
MAISLFLGRIKLFHANSPNSSLHQKKQNATWHFAEPSLIIAGSSFLNPLPKKN